MLQPQKHGGYSDYQTILSDDCRGCAAGRFLGRNAISLWKVLISNKSVSRLNSDQPGVRYRWRWAVPRTSAAGWPRSIAKEQFALGNQPVCVLAEWRAPASAS
jgi:hypothetical protein